MSLQKNDKTSVRITLELNEDLDYFKVRTNPILATTVVSDCDIIRFLLDLAESLPPNELTAFARSYDISRFGIKGRKGRKPPVTTIQE